MPKSEKQTKRQGKLNKMTKSHSPRLVQHLEHLFDHGDYYDVIVKSSSGDYKLHQTILSGNLFFAKAFEFKKNQHQIGQTTDPTAHARDEIVTIDMTDDGPRVLYYFLMTLYFATEEVDYIAEKHSWDSNPLIGACNIWAIGDKYDSADMRQLGDTLVRRAVTFKAVMEDGNDTTAVATYSLDPKFEVALKQMFSVDATPALQAKMDLVVDCLIPRREILKRCEDFIALCEDLELDLAQHMIAYFI